MALWLPEFLQTQKYSAQRMRAMMATSGLLQEGIVDAGDYKVSQRGAGANMSVDIAAGEAWVKGDDAARQGWYHVVNDGTVNLAIPAAHATLPRVDQVVLRVYDSTVIGGPTDAAMLEVVSGTATAGASLSNRTGAAALPATAIRLADVLIAAAGTKIENAAIGNLRSPRAGTTGYPAAVAPLSVAGAPPQYAYGRPRFYVPMVEAIRSGALAMANAAEVYVPWQSEAVDLDTMRTGEDTKITIATPGMYMFVLHGGMNASGNFEAWFRVNGAGEHFYRNGYSGAAGKVLMVGTRYTESGTYYEFGVFQNSGGARELTSARVTAIWQGP
jgi:hypothetical protein